MRMNDIPTGDGDLLNDTSSAELALDEIVFDERNVDENGFAQVFEDVIKPGLAQTFAWQRDVMGRSRAQYAERSRRTRGIRWLLRALTLAGLLVVFSGDRLPAAGLGYLLPIGIFGLLGSLVAGFFLFIWRILPPAGLIGRGAPFPPTALYTEVLKRFALAADEERQRGMREFNGSFFDIRGLTEINGHVSGRSWNIDVDMWYVTKKSESEKRGDIIHFMGWFVLMKLPFSFDSTTMIAGRKGGFQPFAGTSALQHVDLEDPVFMKRFKVWSSDQVEARMILSPDVMADLVRNAERLSGWWGEGDVAIGIKGDRAYFLLPFRTTMDLSRMPSDPKAVVEKLHSAFSEFGTIVDLIKDIDAISEAEGQRGEMRRNLAGE